MNFLSWHTLYVLSSFRLVTWFFENIALEEVLIALRKSIALRIFQSFLFLLNVSSSRSSHCVYKTSQFLITQTLNIECVILIHVALASFITKYLNILHADSHMFCLLPKHVCWISRARQNVALERA